MELVRSWLMSLIAVSLLCAVAGALMPKGAVRRVGRLVCGLVILSAVLSPVAGLDAADGQRWLAGYLAAVEQRRAGLEETVNSQMKSIIEEKYAAYIVDKAAELGLTCTARVECRRSAEGLYLPVRAEVDGEMTEGGRVRLSGAITEDLGIPKQAQVFCDGRG